MAQEIERKFLVHPSWKSTTTLASKQKLTQGYLSKSPNSTVRIRLVEVGAARSAYITIKSKRVGLSCDEFEYTIPYEDGLALIKMSVTPLIKKTRYYVDDQHGQRWDIDVFRGPNKGLVIAEIELASADQAVTLPDWVSTEVSHDRRYTNLHIATHPIA